MSKPDPVEVMRAKVKAKSESLKRFRVVQGKASAVGCTLRTIDGERWRIRDGNEPLSAPFTLEELERIFS